MDFKTLKDTVRTAIICSFFGGALGALVAGLLVKLAEVFAPTMIEEDPSMVIMVVWFGMWSSIVTIWWVKTNGLPGDD